MFSNECWKANHILHGKIGGNRWTLRPVFCTLVQKQRLHKYLLLLYWMMFTVYCSQYISPISKEVWVLENEKWNKNKNRSTTILPQQICMLFDAYWWNSGGHHMIVFKLFYSCSFWENYLGKWKCVSCMVYVRSPHMNTKVIHSFNDSTDTKCGNKIKFLCCTFAWEHSV